MSVFWKTVVAVGLAIASSAPASAVIVTFASFTSVNSASNVRWVNNGVASNSSISNTSTGTGGYFYTTSTGTSRVPGSAPVTFSFLQPALASLGAINANFFMNITVTNSPAAASGVFRLQDIPSGSFSFTSTQAMYVGSTFYAAGSNLLTGTFTNGTIFGTGTSGSFSGSSTDGALMFTSDFLNFGNTNARDYSMSLNSITPALFRTSGRALRTFRATAGGGFSSDPAPLINAIPEPASWALLISGFGMVGGRLRRRSGAVAVTA